MSLRLHESQTCISPDICMCLATVCEEGLWLQVDRVPPPPLGVLLPSITFTRNLSQTLPMRHNRRRGVRCDRQHLFQVSIAACNPSRVVKTGLLPSPRRAFFFCVCACVDPHGNYPLNNIPTPLHTPRLRHLTAGLGRAHSLGFDLHKWMYLPFAIGCVLVRDGDAHRNTFTVPGSYIDRMCKGKEMDWDRGGGGGLLYFRKRYFARSSPCHPCRCLLSPLFPDPEQSGGASNPLCG